LGRGIPKGEKGVTTWWDGKLSIMMEGQGGGGGWIYLWSIGYGEMKYPSWGEVRVEQKTTHKHIVLNDS
jgi:hypothetical protein